MKNLMMFLFAFACVSVSPLSADERSDVYSKLVTLKQEFAARLSKIESVEFGAENRKAGEAEAAVKKAIEELPALAPQRKARDALKLDEVKKLKAASTAQHKKVDALVHRLVAESGAEGKELVEKIKRLEARRQELEK